MKMHLLTIAIAVTMLSPLALAHDGYRQDSRTNVAASISWSTRDRNGNRFGITFRVDRRGFDVLAAYDQQSRYDRYGRGDYDYRRPCPPDFDFRHYRKGQYDSRYFDSYDEWCDWRDWTSRWNRHDRNWYRNYDERHRAWVAFLSERSRAAIDYYRRHDNRHSKYDYRRRDSRYNRYDYRRGDDRRGDGDHDRDDRGHDRGEHRGHEH
ncbi:MAG TPA: hypothetical protein VNI20_11965 [Fimbriimonadaceae bacterium]|nr:hypothetical protein [Fimbriimonadaceae bacterium]